MRPLNYLLFAAALVVAGCSGDSSPQKQVTTTDAGPDGGGTSTPDGGATTTPDGGGTATPDGGTAAITLVEFVTDLVKNKTNETGTPETIDDKMITDTMDPTAFDSLF
jgi:hypothetical protein